MIHAEPLRRGIGCLAWQMSFQKWADYEEGSDTEVFTAVKRVTEGDESEVLVAQVQPAAGRRGGFSGNLPLHPWLSLMPLCWRTHQSLSQFTAIHQQQRDRQADGGRKRGVVSPQTQRLDHGKLV